MAETILKLSRNLGQIDTNKAFLTDQIHYQVTFTVLIIFAIASTSLQFYADPIQCIQPAQFTDGYTSFARTLCWLNNTYFYPQTYTRLPMDKSQRVQQSLHYYQWLPFVFLIQAFCFLLPHLIWISFYQRNGLNPGVLVKRAQKFTKKPEISRSVAKEIERYLMCRQLARCKKKLLLRQNANPSTAPLILPNVSFRIRSHSYFLVTLYLFIKILYILNIILQVLVLDSILSTGNYGFVRFGSDTMKYLFRTSLRDRISSLSYEHQQLFPFVTLCDFHIRELGQDHSYTIECILLINIFYEKIYFAIWIWFVFLFSLSILSLFYSIYRYIPFYARSRFLNQLLDLIEAKREQTHSWTIDPSTEATTTEVIDAARRRGFVRWIEHDGIFLLHLLNRHSGEPLVIQCLEDLLNIWTDNYEDHSNLAERLLTNRFQFTK